MPALKYLFTDDVLRHHRDHALDELGNMIVDRFDQLEKLIDRHPKLCPGITPKPLVEYFVQSNLPICQVDAPFFRKFVS
jgi:hypothetical protein